MFFERWLLLLCVVISPAGLTGCTSTDSKDKTAAAEKDKDKDKGGNAAVDPTADLQGTWVGVDGEEKGRKIPAAEVSQDGLVIKGNEMEFQRGGKTMKKFAFTVDPTRKPGNIDLKAEDGGVVHAIYALENGQLKLCLWNQFSSNKPEERPQEFRTARGAADAPRGGNLMFVYKKDAK